MKRSSNELIVHGIIGGLLAGLVVAVWFAVVDTVRWGHPFVTPTDLARALYHQPGTGSTVWLVAMYSVVHFGVFACLGIAATWVMVALHTTPRLLLGVFFGIVVQELAVLHGAVPQRVAPVRGHPLGPRHRRKPAGRVGPDELSAPR